jgi:hypothetical protein
MAYEGEEAYKAIEILNRVNPPFPVDLLVRTPGEIKRRIALNDSFLQEIFTRGRVLYAATHG